MSETDEKHSPLSEFKHNLDEVLELLNKANVPVIITEDSNADAIAQQLLGGQELTGRPAEPIIGKPNK
jgi:hypothetical protein